MVPVSSLLFLLRKTGERGRRFERPDSQGPAAYGEPCSHVGCSERAAVSYTTVIGLEVHVQLKTASKIFCSCSTQFGARPNSQVCPVCLGFPGTLPVLNRQVLLYGIRVALGLGCSIQPRIVFHRKNYFYPDLPKNFQISQYDLPLGSDGILQIGPRTIRVLRVHMEEDAGKLIHKEGEDASLVDFNRTGMPLLEIVSQPDITSPEEAHQYLKMLKGILQYLEVSDCDMEKGSLRCDANVSLSVTPGILGTKVEIKNLNSFKGVARALAYEIQRQTAALDAGEKINQETRLWDDLRAQTQPMRSKEFAHDYRYFPEPDLVPFAVSAQEVEKVRADLPELASQRAKRFVEQYGLPEADAFTLTAAKLTADYYEDCVKAVPAAQKGAVKKMAANWIINDLAREMNERNLDDIRALEFPPESLLELLSLVDSGSIGRKTAIQVLMESIKEKQPPKKIVAMKGLVQINNPETLKTGARQVIEENPKAVEDYKNGKESALMFLVGQLMRMTKGTASPSVSQEILRELLKEKQP